MAIAKWIPFGTQSVTVASEATKPQHVQATPADGKQFGLENVRISFQGMCEYVRVTEYPVDNLVWQYLVRVFKCSVQAGAGADHPRRSYANSILQALYFCSPFRELVLQCPDPSLALPQKPTAAAISTSTPLPSMSAARRKPERKTTSESLPTNGTVHLPGPPIPPTPATLFSALRSLFIHISRNPADKGTVAPRAFIEKLKDLNSEFRNMNQQDAHEFLNFLLNKIVEEILEDRKYHQGVSPSGEDCEYHSYILQFVVSMDHLVDSVSFRRDIVLSYHYNRDDELQFRYLPAGCDFGT
jgi:ubiquitin carboxyl-terminal hydrolase 9/13